MATRREQRPKPVRTPARRSTRRTDADRLDALAKDVRDGTYLVDADALARRLLDEWRALESPIESALARVTQSERSAASASAPADGEVLEEPGPRIER